MTAKANTRKTTADRIKQTKRDNKKLYALGRNISSGVAQQSGIGSGLGGGGQNIGRGQFLPVAGGEMQGPIGFFPKAIAILTDEIDITEGGQFNGYSSSVIVTAETGSTDDLETITGGRFAGQLLFVQTQPSETITVKASGNIDTIGGGDYQIDPDEEVLFKYSLTSDVWKQLTHAQTLGADLAMGAFDIVGGKDFYGVKFRDKVEPIANWFGFDSGNVIVHSSDEDNDVIIEALGTSSDVIINSSDGMIDLQNAGATVMRILSGGVTFQSGSNPIFNDDVIFGAFHGQYNDIADSSVGNPSAGNRRVYYSSDSDSMVAKDSGGTVHDLEGVVAGGANVNLSNLAAVAVNVSIDPDADGTLDLGSGALSWNDVNLDRILFRHNNGILSTLASIGRSSNSLVLNTPTTEQIFLQVGGTDEYFFDNLGFNLKNLNGINFLSSTDAQDIQLTKSGSDFHIRNNTVLGGVLIESDAVIPSVFLKGRNSADGTLAHEIVFQGFDVGGSLVRDYGSIKVRQIATGTGVEDAGMEFRLQEGGTFDTLYLHLNAQAGEVQLSKNLHLNSGVQLNLNANFAQFDDKTDASVGTPGTGIRRVYYSTDSDSMVAKDSAGVVHDLEASGSGANVNLSNLASVAVNVDLLPNTDDDVDLGSASKQWQNLFVDGTANMDVLSVSNAASEGVGSDLFPTADVTWNIGGAGRRFAAFYALAYRLPTSSADSTTRILSNTGGIEYHVASGDVHDFLVFASSQFEVNATGVRIGGTSTNTIDGDGNGFEYDVAAGDAHDFSIDGNLAFEIDATQILCNNADLVLSQSDLKIVEKSASTGETNTGIVFADNGGAGGKSRLMVIFQTGAAQVIATEP